MSKVLINSPDNVVTVTAAFLISKLSLRYGDESTDGKSTLILPLDKLNESFEASAVTKSACAVTKSVGSGALQLVEVLSFHWTRLLPPMKLN